MINGKVKLVFFYSDGIGDYIAWHSGTFAAGQCHENFDEMGNSVKATFGIERKKKE